MRRAAKGLGSGVLCGALLAGCIPAPEPERAPNVLLIVADDLGYTDLGLLGSEIRTPNLDELARHGLLLTRFYVSPACSPTRAMLLSGVDAHPAGLGTMAGENDPRQQGQPGYEGVLSGDVVTLAERLRDAGYHTYTVGKWHLGTEPAQDPHARGFERSFGLIPGGASHFADAATLRRSASPAAYREDGRDVALSEDFYSSDAYTDRLIDHLRSGLGDERPFFAYAAYTSPHWPLQVPDDERDRYAGVYDAGYDALRQRRIQAARDAGVFGPTAPAAERLPFAPPWEELSPEQQRVEARTMEIYAAMVENLDDNVGRLLDFLAETDQLEQTLVMFFSDNGAEGNPIAAMTGNAEWIPERFDNRWENLGRRGSYLFLGPGWGQATAGPFRLFKSFPSEAGVRVPAIVKPPGPVSYGGRRSAATATVLDVAPTLLEVAGLDPAAATNAGRALEGRSLMPLLRGESDTVHGEGAVLGWELFGRCAILQGDWKAMWLWEPYGPGRWELFDLARDPGETRDLASEEPQRLAELIRHWDAYVERNRVVLPVRAAGYALETN